MIWIMHIVFVLVFWGVLDLINGLIGLWIYRYKLLHRVGLRMMAYSPLFAKLLPARCRLCCGEDKCGNWTCPKY